MVNALAGGKVDLSNLTSYTSGSTHFTADGAASTIDLSKLPGLLSDAGSGSSLQATNGGTISLNSGTVDLTGVAISVASTGTIVGGTLQLFGGTLSGNSTIQANVFSSGTTSPAATARER